jgi:hypothetical protein
MGAAQYPEVARKLLLLLLGGLLGLFLGSHGSTSFEINRLRVPRWRTQYLV